MRSGVSTSGIYGIDECLLKLRLHDLIFWNGRINAPAAFIHPCRPTVAKQLLDVRDKK
jgi:hypothetical protein